MAIDREKLHELINHLEPQDFNKVYKILQAFSNESSEFDVESFFEGLPVDDEPLSKEESEAIKLGEEEIARGEYVLWEDLKRELQANRDSK